MKLEKKLYVSGPIRENDMEIHSLCENPMGEDDTLYIRADQIEKLIEDYERRIDTASDMISQSRITPISDMIGQSRNNPEVSKRMRTKRSEWRTFVKELKKLIQ